MLSDQKDCMCPKISVGIFKLYHPGYFRVLFPYSLGYLQTFFVPLFPFFNGLQKYLRKKKSCKKKTVFSEFWVPARNVQWYVICYVMVERVRRLSRRHDLPRRADCHCRLQLTSGLPRRLRGPNHWPYCCPEFKGHDGTVEIVILDVCHILFY